MILKTDGHLAALVLQNEGQPGQFQAAAAGARQAPGTLLGAAGETQRRCWPAEDIPGGFLQQPQICTAGDSAWRVHCSLSWLDA